MRLRNMLFLIPLLACGRGTPPAGEVVFGTITVETGNVPANVLTDKLSAKHPIIEGCYADELSKNPKVEGALDMKLTGEERGTRVDVTKNTVGSESLLQCVRLAIQSIQADSTGTFGADWSLNFNRKG